jgi:DNA modification methylase
MFQLFNSDCLEGLKRLESDNFDLALIDPPYFDYKTNHRAKGHKFTTSFHQQTREEQLEVITECKRLVKPGGAFYVFLNWDNIWWVQQRFETFFRNLIIWDKGNWPAGDLRGSLANKYEVVFLGTKGDGWAYRGGRIHDIWFHPRVGNNRIHATEKPVELYKQCIEVATDAGMLVVDPYAGSGASIQASLELGRSIISWELDPDYYRLALERSYGVEKILALAPGLPLGSQP